MATLIDMPKLSDTMTVGTLVRWLKNEGDAVTNGDMIAEVETDKATMEVECFDDGILIKQYCGEGAEVAVGDPIAAVGEAGEEAPAGTSSAPAKEAPAAPEPTAEAPAPAEAEPAPVAEAPAPAAAPATSSTGGRIKASPLAKKIAAEKGLDLATIQGSGPGGRILKEDVLNAKPVAAAPAAAAGAPAAAPAATLEALDIPVTNMRKSIGKALVASKTQAPHFYLQIEVNGAPLAALRKQLNGQLADLPAEQGGAKFSVNDLTLKAAAEAVRRVPAINRSWEGDTIKQHANVHLAFGVAIDDGLVTPVIRAAETKGLREIGAEAKVLIKKARGKKLTPNEMSGSTLTVTNLGMFGISDFYGIINPNNAAILSIGATIKKPVVNENDEIVVGQVMKIGLSGDHRTIDGAVGAQYLQALKEILEAPATMLV
ncbi:MULTISPECIES: dihydrolipoamide acetyltransferase family protein [unclassified Lentimonas]|uniref:dihydrolipoamide acetyltransferase family protein n=1 Tax=unclassified Lentimonas TaxID=2630993 RepID=UPI00132BF81F|nr:MULTISPECIES: dihydrolipoamide acetyltransferase family protein [unclassified Lentimonas]CAA6676357.1 Dihydrolipoamide acetyltransferase component of pyruvate dehydrogenase complex (EC [Lentimonas sp. CC4]CAA6685195.1 Dihydrolipoamide acetyltransferase component of pyruvate dehydrogenase complex (EC [Lentimonas sp. CC6]CAA7075079.1 Dihydrolipoamide acetyltransferase component of pyruvate dehydrogenase complex (EC [Lentimonas sp. CC4]CAA7169615.1 Dihydrolipoamide acetyltransferase component o